VEFLLDPRVQEAHGKNQGAFQEALWVGIHASSYQEEAEESLQREVENLVAEIAEIQEGAL